MLYPVKSQGPVASSQRAEDLSLARAAAAGDPGARHLLVERLMDRIYRTLSYLARSREEAEDITQAALINILRAAGSFRGECSLEYWATRVAIQTMAKKLEKRTRRERLREVRWEPPLETRDTDDEVDLLRARSRLTQKIQTLTIEQRTAVVLHYLHGYDIAEISEITGSSPNTTRGRLRDGRRHLKKKILADPMLRDWLRGRQR